MWGLLTNMVSTRRSSARLQEKQGASSAPSSPTPSASAASPSTRRSRSTTKASSPPQRATPTKASPGSATKRGRPRKLAAEHASDESAATQSDAASDPHTDNGSAGEEKDAPVNQELLTEVVETIVEAAVAATTSNDPESIAEEGSEKEIETVVTQVTEVEVAVELEMVEKMEPTGVAEVIEEEEEEVEQEIVMMDTSEGEEDNEEEEEDEEDMDVEAYAKMAASSISLSTTAKSNTGASAAATKAERHLVPDTLDSGASSRTKFLEFEGTKQAFGAKVVATTAAAEEQKVLAQQLGRVAKSNRQRTEAQNLTSAGRKWFGMATHEMDADARRDFALLKMRNYLDPKKFYKTSDHTKKMPTHFQMGTVIEGAHEFKSARLTKKERQQTFTDEIMADDSVRSYTKRVFLQVQNARAGAHGSKKKKQRRF